MHNPLERKTTIFIIRVWQEYHISDSADIRGEIVHVSGQKKEFFTSIEELEKFIFTICKEEKTQPD